MFTVRNRCQEDLLYWYMYDDMTMQSVFGSPNHSTYTEPWRQTYLEHVLIFYGNIISFLRPINSISNMGLVQLLSCWAVPACTSLFLASSIYAFLLYLYRLFLHPPASFPGPPLAAMTNWYKFYHEFFSPGDQFIFRIRDTHIKYRSPIVHISSGELHINHICFLPELMPVLAAIAATNILVIRESSAALRPQPLS